MLFSTPQRKLRLEALEQRNLLSCLNDCCDGPLSVRAELAGFATQEPASGFAQGRDTTRGRG